MGLGRDKVPFLGHGIGLTVDETPVFAKGFTAPLEQGMVVAIEPKIGIPGSGMVGLEHTLGNHRVRSSSAYGDIKANHPDRLISLSYPVSCRYDCDAAQKRACFASTILLPLGRDLWRPLPLLFPCFPLARMH